MTHAEVAADIRKHSPGALPGSFRFDHHGRPCSVTSIEDCYDSGDTDWGDITHIYNPVADDIAESVLRDTMVRDAEMAREYGAYYSFNQAQVTKHRGFHDSDYGGSLQACHAAWRFARGIA